MAIRNRSFLMMTQEEVTQEVIQFYADILPNAKVLVSGGKDESNMPNIILEKGIEHLTLEELIDVAGCWSENYLEQTEEKMKAIGDVGKPPIAIIMTVPVRPNAVEFNGYLLGHLYRQDFEIPQGCIGTEFC